MKHVLALSLVVDPARHWFAVKEDKIFSLEAAIPTVFDDTADLLEC